MKLTPPDRNRCQADVSNGAGPFTVGGVPGRVRCSEKPKTIITEAEPGADGLRGSMSLCDSCLGIAEGYVKEGKLKPVTKKPIK